MAARDVIGRAVAVAAAVLLVAGCATLTPQDDERHVQQWLDDRVPEGPAWGEEAAEIQARIDELLAEPLGPGEAVRVAMLANPEIQSGMAVAGMSRAEVIQASRLPNPRLGLGLAVSSESGARTEIHTGIAFDLMALFLRPARQDIADREYERDTRRVAHSLVDLATRVESAWFHYVGTRQVAEMRAIITEAAEASAELAERFYRAGNISELQLERERAAATRARLEAGRAELDARRARLALNRLMGLSSNRDRWRAAERLPAVLEVAESEANLLATARARRLDLQSLEYEVAALERAFDASRRWRYVADVGERHLTPAGAVDLGVVRERESDGERLIGPTLGLRLPVFDQGQGSLARADARLAYARGRLDARRLDVEREVRQALVDAETGHAMALEYRDSLIPQREAIVARSQEFHDYMFIGAFELIAARQLEYDAYQGYIEAVRDFWLARVELARAVGASLAMPFDKDEMLDFDRLLAPPEEEEHDPHRHHRHH